MAPAPPPAPLRFAERGPFAAGVVDREVPGPEGRRLPVSVWYPADPVLRGRDLLPDHHAPHPYGRPHRAIPGARPAAGPFPLVLFSHGNSGLRQQSTFLTAHLASHGFVVAAPDHVGNTFFEMLPIADPQTLRAVHRRARRNRPDDLRATLDALLADEPFGPRLKAVRVAALGHSFGGWTAVKVASRDPRISAVCGLAPASEPFVGRRAFDPGELPLPRPVPVLLVAGLDDVLVELDESVRPLFDRLAPPRALLGIRGADHFHFCDGVELLHSRHFANPREGQRRPTRPLAELLPEARIHRLLCGVVTAFLHAALSGTEPEAALAPEALATLDGALVRLA